MESVLLPVIFPTFFPFPPSVCKFFSLHLHTRNNTASLHLDHPEYSIKSIIFPTTTAELPYFHISSANIVAHLLRPLSLRTSSTSPPSALPPDFYAFRVRPPPCYHSIRTSTHVPPPCYHSIRTSTHVPPPCYRVSTCEGDKNRRVVDGPPPSLITPADRPVAAPPAGRTGADCSWAARARRCTPARDSDSNRNSRRRYSG